jgi:hypothetical protein
MRNRSTIGIIKIDGAFNSLSAVQVDDLQIVARKI